MIRDVTRFRQAKVLENERDLGYFTLEEIDTRVGFVLELVIKKLEAEEINKTKHPSAYHIHFSYRLRFI